MAQDEPVVEDSEFKDTAGILLQLRIHGGLATNFKSSPDLYVGGVQLAAYWTPKPLVHVMRIGLCGDVFYTSKKLEAAVGPSILLKVKTLTDKLGRFGSFGNIHLAIDHLWGTDNYRLFGGGLAFETDFLTLGLTTHRDYFHNTWWFETMVGIRLSKKQKVPSVDDLPHNPN